MTQIQGFDFSVDLLRALLWEYNDAARLESLLQQKQDWYNVNQQAYWENWARDVFDLRTANDFGLSVWAIILDIPLAVASAADAADKPIWGFGPYREGFTRGNFANTSAASLTTEQRRLLLRLRYFQLVTRGTVPEVNAFFGDLFASLGPVYVNDGLDMTALYVFDFPLSSALEMLLTEYDLLPRPAGVKVNYVITGDSAGWGFGRYHLNFNNGNFNNA